MQKTAQKIRKVKKKTVVWSKQIQLKGRFDIPAKDVDLLDGVEFGRHKN